MAEYNRRGWAVLGTKALREYRELSSAVSSTHRPPAKVLRERARRIIAEHDWQAGEFDYLPAQADSWQEPTRQPDEEL